MLFRSQVNNQVQSSPLNIKSEKNLMPHPQDRILVPLRGSFQNFRRVARPFKWESPPYLPWGNETVVTTVATGLKSDDCDKCISGWLWRTMRVYLPSLNDEMIVPTIVGKDGILATQK